MKKISTLFVVDYSTSSECKVTRTVREENKWVYDELNVRATRKLDGTACMIKDSELYKRYDVKPTKNAFKNHIAGTKWLIEDFNIIPDYAIACQEPDLITGHHPHWIKCDRNNSQDKYFFLGYDTIWSSYWLDVTDGTYELVGEKIGTNPENIKGHTLIKHGSVMINDLSSFSFDDIKEYLTNPNNNIEGIVFYGSDDKMCKIRKKDFGVKR